MTQHHSDPSPMVGCRNGILCSSTDVGQMDIEEQSLVPRASLEPKEGEVQAGLLLRNQSQPS